MIKNKFIVIEGLEGSGKTQACKHVKNILNHNHVTKILLVRQPGSTPIAEEIRKLIKKKIIVTTLLKKLNYY